MKPLNLVLSIAAGVLGGVVSPYLYEPSPVQAQAIIPAPKIVDAGAFRLLSEVGRLAGTLAINANGEGVIRMFDATGKVIFTSEDKPVIKPAGIR